jgi:hypothetical protein
MKFKSVLSAVCFFFIAMAQASDESMSREFQAQIKKNEEAFTMIAGYEWSEQSNPKNLEECRNIYQQFRESCDSGRIHKGLGCKGGSGSFIEGCKAYISEKGDEKPDSRS